MAQYLLKSPIIGVERSSSGMRLTHIGTGEIVSIPDDEEDGLVELVLRGKNVCVFVQDVADRGERIETKPAAGVVSIRRRLTRRVS